MLLSAGSNLQPHTGVLSVEKVSFDKDLRLHTYSVERYKDLMIVKKKFFMLSVSVARGQCSRWRTTSQIVADLRLNEKQRPRGHWSETGTINHWMSVRETSVHVSGDRETHNWIRNTCTAYRKTWTPSRRVTSGDVVKYLDLLRISLCMWCSEIVWNSSEFRTGMSRKFWEFFFI